MPRLSQTHVQIGGRILSWIRLVVRQRRVLIAVQYRCRGARLSARSVVTVRIRRTNRLVTTRDWRRRDSGLSATRIRVSIVQDHFCIQYALVFLSLYRIDPYIHLRRVGKDVLVLPSLGEVGAFL